MRPAPTNLRLYPKVKDVNIALHAYCTGCEVGVAYQDRENQLKDMKHPTGAVLLGEDGDNILNDPTLNELKMVCDRCLKSHYPELLIAIQNQISPWER